jgi:nucleoside 2-deoxyribosyltransferase
VRRCVYLAGPINGRSDTEVFGWRSEVRCELEACGVRVLDPSERDFRGEEADRTAEIVESDKADIDRADTVLAYARTPSVGTSMEILYAFSHPLPKVVIVVAQPNPSPWLVYHSDYIVGSLPEAVQLIKDLSK